MDGRGRAFDNIFVERLWRSVKYEDVYLKSYQTMAEAQKGLKEYFRFYNNERSVGSGSPCSSGARISDAKRSVYGQYKLKKKIDKFKMIYKKEGQQEQKNRGVELQNVS